MYKIIDVKCDYSVCPIGIDNTAPKFSWRFNDTKDNFVQSSYRILVSDTIELINSHNGNMWDSGVIKSSINCGIVYGGKELQSRQRYYFVVITSAEQGEQVSEVAYFEMGILNKEQWLGNWMAAPCNWAGSAVYYRKICEINDKPIVRARAYISGIGYSELYFNGVKMGDSVLSPDCTDYNKRVTYCTHDITKNVKFGRNNVTVLAGNGWLGNSKVMLQIYIEYNDGTLAEFHSDSQGGWMCSGSAITSNSIYGGEVFDSRLDEPLKKLLNNTDDVWFASTGWGFPILADVPMGTLCASFIEPIKVIRDVPYVKMQKINNRTFVYDMGQIFAGWTQITVSGSRGSSVTIRHAEGINSDGTINQLNLRSAKATDVYTLSGNGEEKYSPRFTYHGFRYVQIELSDDIDLINVVGQVVRSSVEAVGKFECSDMVINQIHKNAALTEESNMHSIPTDCPQRDERFGWLNDMTSRMDQSINNYNLSKFYSKFVRDISDTQDELGRISDTAPYKIGSRPADTTVVSYVMFGDRLARHYGDTQISTAHYQGMKKWVEYLVSLSIDGLLEYSLYGDWCPPLKHSVGGNSTLNAVCVGKYLASAYYYFHVDMLYKVAQIIGNAFDAKHYSQLANKIKKAFNNKYFDATTCNYDSGSQSCNAIALNIGLCEEKYAAKVAQNIANDIIRNDYHLTSGNQGYKHVLESISKYGHIDTLHRMVTNPTYPGWGFMVARGATSIWERWEEDMLSDMNSFCHPMLGSVDSWFYQHLAGISVSEQAMGFNQLEISPKIPSRIEWVNCSHQSINGEIMSNWRKLNGTIEYTIVVPPNVSANIVLSHNKVVVNGTSHVGKNLSTKIAVGSGKYLIMGEIDEKNC